MFECVGGKAHRAVPTAYPRSRLHDGHASLCPPYTLTRLCILAARIARVFPSIHPRLQKRAQGRPGALRTHGPRATKKHAAEPQVRAGTPGLPCAMVLRLIRDLPGDQALLSPSPRVISRNVAPALGRQDHTTSPSAIMSFVSTTHRVHRIPLPTSVTIAKRPSCGERDARMIVLICPTTQEKMCTTGSLRMAGMHSRDSLHVIASASDLSAEAQRA